jgi:4-amino-4-deoxy-L-arabinose transferase-like glycosyltransferase
LSVAYRLFGVHANTAFAVNAAAMAGIVCAVYVLTWLLFRDRDAALFAGLLLALTPQQIIWSATAAVEPSASLAAVMALVCAAYYSSRGGSTALAAFAAVAAYAIQFRPESILILPVAALLMWPRLRPEAGQPGAWWAGLLFLALASVHIAHLYAVRNVEWGTNQARFSLAYVPANLAVNGWFYLRDERFPVLFTLLAASGLSTPGFRRARLAMALYFLVYFSIGLVFYAGSYNYGDRGPCRRRRIERRSSPGSARAAGQVRDGHRHGVRVSLVRTGRTRHDGRGLGSSRRCALRPDVCLRAAQQLVRADPQPRYVPDMGI